jgi:hypothetical protein
MQDVWSLRLFRLAPIVSISAWLIYGFAHGEETTHPGNTIARFSIPDGDQYCKQLHLVIASAKDGFKSISEGQGMFRSSRILLPDMSCSITYNLPYLSLQAAQGKVPKPESPFYWVYSCQVFANERENDATVKLNAYADFTSNCLGQSWLRGDTHDRPSVAGKEISITGQSGEAKIQMETSIKDNGTRMFIDIYLPPPDTGSRPTRGRR